MSGDCGDARPVASQTRVWKPGQCCSLLVLRPQGSLRVGVVCRNGDDPLVFLSDFPLLQVTLAVEIAALSDRSRTPLGAFSHPAFAERRGCTWFSKEISSDPDKLCGSTCSGSVSSDKSVHLSNGSHGCRLRRYGKKSYMGFHMQR